MLRFPVSLLLLLGSAESLRTSRQLSFGSIAGYEPETSVTDHNALDQDQYEMETQLGLEVPNFDAAYSVYSEGYASKSIATLTLSDLSAAIPEGTRVVGTGNDGTRVAGVTTEAVTPGATSLEVEYEVSDDQANHVRCKVGGSTTPMTDGCFQDGEGTIQADGNTITYTAVENTNGRTLQGFSTEADTKMRPADANGDASTTNPYFPDFQKFVDFYGSPNYADKWITAALLGNNADLAKGNADFSKYTDVARVEAAKKGSAYMNVGMYAIRELEDAIDDCERGCDTEDCNMDAVHAWDEGVAFYTGSMEGSDGSSDGVFFYSLADKRCENFKTCGRDANEVSGTSKINHEIFSYFDQGKRLFQNKQCSAARDVKSKIVQRMWVPFVQGSLRYAWKLQNEPFDEKSLAEGATFLAGVLPMIHSCNSADADLIYAQMGFGSEEGGTDFPAVKKAFENNYECLGMTCADVGGLWNDATGEYEVDAEPCGSGRGRSSSSKSDVNLGLAVGLPIGLLVAFALIYLFACRRRKSEVEFKSNDTGSGV